MTTAGDGEPDPIWGVPPEEFAQVGERFADAINKMERAHVKLGVTADALLAGDHFDAAEIVRAAHRESLEASRGIVLAVRDLDFRIAQGFLRRRRELRGET